MILKWLDLLVKPKNLKKKSSRKNNWENDSDEAI